MLKHMTFRAIKDDNKAGWTSHTVTVEGAMFPIIELYTSQTRHDLVRMEMKTVKPTDGKDAADMRDMVTYALNCAAVDHIVTYPDGSAVAFYLRSFGKIESADELVTRIGETWRGMTDNEQ